MGEGHRCVHISGQLLPLESAGVELENGSIRGLESSR